MSGPCRQPPLASAILVPELQHWFNNFIVHSVVNKNFIPFPVDIAPLYLGANSFIELLFNDNYSKHSYEYRYAQETNPFCIPRQVFMRIQVYPGASKYLRLDPTGNNVFNLQQDDFTLLDSLLAYRDSTAVVILDTTGTAIFDATAQILYAHYDNLSTNLSKMIYLYLDLMINENYQRYNNLILLSNQTLLDCCFEAYLIEQYYNFMSQRVPSLIYTPPYGGPGTCLP